jgi:hypothetical protein
MRSSRLLVSLLATLLIVVACGDDTGTTTTTFPTTTTASSTTSAVETTTTEPADPRPLAGFALAPVEDPLYGSGYHSMTLDESGTIATSIDPIVGDTAGANLLGLGTMNPYPTMVGVDPGMIVVVAWVESPTDDVQPTPGAVVLYREAAQGWEALAAITDPIVLGFLETTTDFAAWKPATGIPYARTTVKALDWDGSAHFVADVQVLDFPANANEFLAEIECTLNGALECVLLSDDGVLRPGDEGQAVEDLQLALIEMGYLSPPPDGKYGPATETAVRTLQRDFRVTRDGRVGEQTQALIDDILAGTIVLASKDGIGPVEFGTAAETAVPALNALLGSPDYTIGWQVGPCGTWEWYKVTWGGITAIFTEQEGPRRFDGWEVTDLAAVPPGIYFAGGIAPSWTWSNFDAMGAGYDSGYQWWYHTGLGYGLGTFVIQPPSDPPAANAKVQGFGTGTGAILYDC